MVTLETVSEIGEFVSNLALKADLLSYVRKAFEGFGNDAGKVAKCIYQYLLKDHGKDTWYVCVYEDGTSYLRYFDDYCFLNAIFGGKVYCIRVCKFLNTGCLYIQASANSAISSEKKATIVEKGSIDVDMLYLFYGRSFLADGKYILENISIFIVEHGEKVGIGKNWAIVEAKNGAFAGCCMEGQYAIFQILDKIYINVRLR